MRSPMTWAFHIDSVEFTPAVIDGTASLGGSESACLGLARALQARGHRVHIFTTQLHPDAPSKDAWGVAWHRTADLDALSRFCHWDVFVALRMPHIFNQRIPATVRVLWNQDLLTGEAAKTQTMAFGWAYDVVAYVSHYHRKQWEGVAPELASIGWVCKNGFDPQYVPADVTRHPKRVIHITRPERGLRPLLAMWPEVRRQVPDAELHLCRYNSMYDAQGWGRVCAAYDEQVAAVNAQVGGITWLGELGKPDLYRAIAGAAVMWYPGVADFAETSCVAAIEAQACGTPFVGSYKGALPETVPFGTLIKGDADTPEYQAKSIKAVVGILTSDTLSRQVRDGLVHVQRYTFDRVAQDWEHMATGQMADRRAREPQALLQQLLHEDDHCAAQVLARELGDTATAEWCQYVIDGKDQSADDYGAHALPPLVEMQHSPRIRSVVEQLQGCTTVLDVACGNGAFALALAQADPARRVVGVDYSEANIAVARETAAALGVADRCTFVQGAIYSYKTHTAHETLLDELAALGPFDGVFVGEFCEHIAGVDGFLSAVAARAQTGARMVCTMPSGPFVELASKDVPMRKGHVHQFRAPDLEQVWGTQDWLNVAFLDIGVTPRGQRVGHWIVSCQLNGRPFRPRDLAAAIRRARPKRALSVGILAGETIDLWRCLESVWPVADEIILADTGVGAAALQPFLDAFPRTRRVEVGPVGDLRGGFAEARNATLAAATGAWFLWIDSDERLVDAHALHHYLEGGIFTGYGVKQNHLQLDMGVTFDTPIRVFRRQPDIEFYGCVHEQPQQGDCNGDILPALQLNDVQIAHTGYLTERVRRDKALRRNLPLLIRDGEVFPERRLHQLLVLRDHLNLAQWDSDARGGLTDTGRNHLRKVVELFETHFADPSDKYHPLAYPFYEAAVKQVSGAMEVEVAFAAQVQGLKGRAKPERVWVRHAGQIPVLLRNLQAQWLKLFLPPPPIDVEPISGTEADR